MQEHHDTKQSHEDKHHDEGHAGRLISTDSLKSLYLAERSRRSNVQSLLSVPVSIISFSIFGFVFDTDERYFYVVLAYVVVMYVLGTNLMRSRDGRALVAVRDHYLSAEMMGINLTKYRTLSFGISAFYAGIGGALYAHYLQFVSFEGFTILFSIQFLGMIIIGGLGSIMGSLMGTAFMVLLPESMQWLTDALAAHGLEVDHEAGTVTRVVSESFADLADCSARRAISTGSWPGTIGRVSTPA